MRQINNGLLNFLTNWAINAALIPDILVLIWGRYLCAFVGSVIRLYLNVLQYPFALLWEQFLQQWKRAVNHNYHFFLQVKFSGSFSLQDHKFSWLLLAKVITNSIRIKSWSWVLVNLTSPGSLQNSHLLK